MIKGRQTCQIPHTICYCCAQQCSLDGLILLAYYTNVFGWNDHPDFVYMGINMRSYCTVMHEDALTIDAQIANAYGLAVSAKHISVKINSL